MDTHPEQGPLPWLLFLYQAPTRPTSIRVKTWRRLHELGAIAVRNAVYVLPNSPQAREDFEWLKSEVQAMKGGATVLAAASVDAISRDEIIAAFRTARQADYNAIEKDARTWLRRAAKLMSTDSGRQNLSRAVRQLDERWRHVHSIDWFSAEGADQTAAILRTLSRRAQGEQPSRLATGEKLKTKHYQGRVWVTRPRPGIDRMASAWLIRRFIDARARFTFAADKAGARSRAIPFDMFGAAFGHHGHACTFETLIGRFALEDPALPSIAALVHVLDLKDGCSSPAEAAGFARLVDGLRQAHADDHTLLEHGTVMFEALYRSLSTGRKPE